MWNRNLKKVLVMLRYYTYYSIGGYKNLYLGSSKDVVESTYYLPLLPILEEKAQTDSEAKKEYDKIKSLPSIYQLNDKNTYGLPTIASTLFSHAGYKLMYKHIESKTHALALRDIACGAKDEMGRSIPFLIVITGETSEDINKLNIITTYIASYLTKAEQYIASFINYDSEVNGLCFKLSEFNSWIESIVHNYCSNKIVTQDGVVTIQGSSHKVALLTLPQGISLSLAKAEQKIATNDIKSIFMEKIISKDNIEQVVDQLEQVSENLRQEKARNSILKKMTIGTGIIGFVLGAIIFSCAHK